MQTLHLGVVDLLEDILEGLLQMALHFILRETRSLILNIGQLLSLNFALLYYLLQRLHVLLKFSLFIDEVADHDVLREGVTLLRGVLLLLVNHLLDQDILGRVEAHLLAMTTSWSASLFHVLNQNTFGFLFSYQRLLVEVG